VRTVKPLASNPAIQSAVPADVTKALFSRIDVQAEAKQALPPRTQFLAEPLANALRTSILLPVIIFLLWNTPTVTVLIVHVVLALILLLLIELIGWTPPPAERGTPTSAA
jgi:hypothetical protein